MEMTRALAAALLVTLPASASALDVKLRPCYGPLGATRTTNYLWPGDVLDLSLDIRGLTVGALTGKVFYRIKVDVLDAKGKVLTTAKTEHIKSPDLGGGRLADHVSIASVSQLTPGRYAVNLTVTDTHLIPEVAASARYEFTITEPTLGFRAVQAPAVGMLGQPYLLRVSVANLALDATDRKPRAVIALRVFDERGNKVAVPGEVALPRDRPAAAAGDHVDLAFSFPPNRVGAFDVEIMASDLLANQIAVLRYPLTIITVNANDEPVPAIRSFPADAPPKKPAIDKGAPPPEQLKYTTPAAVVYWQPTCLPRPPILSGLMCRRR
jgi:hypothetical protein